MRPGDASGGTATPAETVASFLPRAYACSPFSFHSIPKFNVLDVIWSAGSGGQSQMEADPAVQLPAVPWSPFSGTEISPDQPLRHPFPVPLLGTLHIPLHRRSRQRF